MARITAIETHYKGFRFRSRLEARWAVFFDTVGIEWQYEPQGFEVFSDLREPDPWEKEPTRDKWLAGLFSAGGAVLGRGEGRLE